MTYGEKLAIDKAIQSQREADAQAGFQKAHEQISTIAYVHDIKFLDDFHIQEICERIKNAILNAEVQP